MAGWHIGVLWDDGLEGADFLAEAQEIEVASAFGEPSGPVTMGKIGAVRFTLMARCGAGHRLPPASVPYRANIDVLKRCGVTDVVALSSAAPVRDGVGLGDWACVTQLVDHTVARERSFFGPGLTASVDLAEPVCLRLAARLAECARSTGAVVHDETVCAVFEGPQMPTGAEIALYRQEGCDLAGMTAMPEARLAREAELPYAMLCIVAARHGATLSATDRERLPELLQSLAGGLPPVREPNPIDTALDGAIVTSPAAWDRGRAMRLDAVAGRALRQGRAEWF